MSGCVTSVIKNNFGVHYMAHVSPLEYVKLLSDNFSEHFHNHWVLEVGSLDINGSIRTFFHDCDYIGLDVSEGNGVDVVSDG